MTLAELRAKIDRREARVGVIGLGYVGLPVACTLARVGFHTLGVDLKADRVAHINAGMSPIEGDEPGLAELLAEVTVSGRLRATCDYEDVRTADVVLVSVETPVDDDHRPEYRSLTSACSALGQVLGEGALVIVESTITPGTIDQVVRPLLEETTGRQLNKGFYLGHCPERVMPGHLLENLGTMSRICGGSTAETAETMVALYRSYVRGDLDTADCVTAELVKTVENAYRDVNIAFANEVALICESVGGDVWRVRELVNKSPGRNVLLPGPGVGGHCIPKDPWLLAAAAKGSIPLRLIPAARAVNDGMPQHVVDLITSGLHRLGRPVSGARVAVLGYAYLENSDDTRNSPSESVVAQLVSCGATVLAQDPYVSGLNRDVEEVIAGSDCAVILVNHRSYAALDWPRLITSMRTPLVVDTRRLFRDEAPPMRDACLLTLGAVGLDRPPTNSKPDSTGTTPPRAPGE